MVRVREVIEALGRGLVVLVALALAVGIGWQLFFELPGNLTELLGVLLTLVLAVGAIRAGGSLAGSILPGYNVAEVAVEGPITRDGGRPSPLAASVGHAADDIVDQIERADETRGVNALVLKLNTPGGEVVPSDDIRRAAEDFDGPTVAYATDTCASGGYWIASGCDELWARDASIVGSIGVIGSRPNISQFMEEHGISYERFAAGEYKDAGLPLKEMEDDDREYLQGIIDDFYDNFVERVAEGRELDPEAVRDTEARVYLGQEAYDIGLVDELGAREDVIDHVETLIGEPARVEEFTPTRGLRARLQGSAQATAYALGAGVASQVTPDDGFEFRL